MSFIFCLPNNINLIYLCSQVSSRTNLCFLKVISQVRKYLLQANINDITGIYVDINLLPLILDFSMYLSTAIVCLTVSGLSFAKYKVIFQTNLEEKTSWTDNVTSKQVTFSLLTNSESFSQPSSIFITSRYSPISTIEISMRATMDFKNRRSI